MATQPLGSVIEHLRTLVAGPVPGDGTDRQLLERFVAAHDQAAFTELVRRHGPMVLGVCRRLLGDGPDTEDAFQATFLVFVRKAGALPWRDNVGGWLYQVAHRVALKARALAARRRSLEQAREDLTPADESGGPASDSAAKELQTVLDEEVQRLPAKYRAPVVLCYLQGRTHEEAARELGWPRGSMAKRLTRALELLRDRLTGRGLALSAAALAAGLTETASATVPAPLANSTVKAATLFAAGEAVGTIPAPAAVLAEGALRSMSLTKLKTALALVLGAAVLVTGAGVLLAHAFAPPNTPDKKADPAPAKRRPADPAQAKADRATLVKGNTAFALDLYSRLRSQEGNVFFSPTSVSTALAMAYNGAEGETAEEMARVLHFSLPQDRLHPAFGSLLQDFNGTDKKRPYQLRVASGLWGLKKFPYRQDFLESTRAHYGADLLQEFDSFADKEARQSINAWVAKQTNDKVKELFAPGVLRETTRRVLGNAVYFMGDWAAQFDERSTTTQPFRVTTDRKVDVPMMHKPDEEFQEQLGRSVQYLDGDTFQAVELPYKGKDLSLVAFLPKKVDGLTSFEKELTAERLTEWLAGLRSSRMVDVRLPRFKMTSRFSLDRTLSAMGMARAFTPGQADFSRMAPKGEWIDAVVHEAVVEVNERGTEAAAATGVALAGSERAQFRADHPFLFLIRDNRSGSILFLGRLVEPSR